MHAGIVRNCDDKSAADTCIRHGEQRIGRDVETDVFHTAKTAPARKRRAERDLQRYLFIGRPLAVNVIVHGGVFRNFCTGGAGVGGQHFAARFIQAPCNRTVAEH